MDTLRDVCNLCEHLFLRRRVYRAGRDEDFFDGKGALTSCCATQVLRPGKHRLHRTSRRSS
jgi:hypothetical protein